MPKKPRAASPATASGPLVAQPVQSLTPAQRRLCLLYAAATCESEAEFERLRDGLSDA